MIVIDSDPAATLKSTFDSACHLEIIELKISPGEDSKKMLSAMREESLLIARTTETFLSLADALCVVLEMVEKCDLESLVFQRDSFRKMLTKLDFNFQSESIRMSLLASINLLDEMVINTKSVEMLKAKSALRELHHNMLEEIAKQQAVLLNRITELQLRATEIFVDIGKGEDPESLHYLNELGEVFSRLDTHS